MNIVFDECIPRPLRQLLPGHTVRTVQETGGTGFTNGRLLAHLSQPGLCDVFITGDRNMPFQQAFASCPFPIVLLRARSNRIADLTPLMPEVLAALPALQPGVVHSIGTWRGKDDARGQ